jgi:hypothetical protein
MDEAEKLPNDAPLERVPRQELEIIFLFAEKFKILGFTKVKKIQQKFPDCIAYRKTPGGMKEVIIEFELKSINFHRHNHNAKKCDCIICWEDNWVDRPENLEIIELRKMFGVLPRIWVMAVGENSKEDLSDIDDVDWSVPSKSHAGDLVLFYYNAPESCIKDIFVINGEYSKEKAGKWTTKTTDIFAKLSRIARIRSPLTYNEIMTDRILSNSQMVAMNMNGRFDITGEWHRIYSILVAKNPNLKKDLAKFSPEKIY